MNIVVTGATKGIGRAIVDLFAEKGWNIAFCSRTQIDINNLLEELQLRYPQQKFFGWAVDLSVNEAVLRFADSVISGMPQIDVLVNNAGIFFPGDILDEPDGKLEAQINLNLYSAYYLTKKFAPIMIAQSSGHIFNMCSVASIKAYPNGGAYSISKYALLGFSENLRMELMNTHVKVTTVLPGATMSDSWSGSGVNHERIMEASDIASSVYNATQLSPQAVVEKIILRPQLGDL